MNVNGAQSAAALDFGAPQGRGKVAEDPKLRHAATQFEGLLLGIMLKESLRENLYEGEKESAGFDQFRDFCVEQVATTMAESSSMGIADQLYEQLSVQGAGR
jgi:Rod binding domain-containing protein